MDNILLQVWNSNIKQQPSKKHTISERFKLKPHKQNIIKENKLSKINTFMKKTIFETLVEQVMSDDELNIIGADSANNGDETSVSETEVDESGDVTIKLSAEQVECLRNILDQIDGNDVDDESNDEEVDTEINTEVDTETEEDEEDFDAFATEAVEAEEIGTPLVNQKKGNPCKPSAGCNKVQGRVTSMAKSGKADSSVTDKVGNDGDEGTPLVNQKKGNPKKPSAGDNKVNGRASQVGSDLFA